MSEMVRGIQNSEKSTGGSSPSRYDEFPLSSMLTIGLRLVVPTVSREEVTKKDKVSVNGSSSSREARTISGEKNGAHWRYILVVNECW